MAEEANCLYLAPEKKEEEEKRDVESKIGRQLPNHFVKHSPTRQIFWKKTVHFITTNIHLSGATNRFLQQCSPLKSCIFADSQACISVNFCRLVPHTHLDSTCNTSNKQPYCILCYVDFNVLSSFPEGQRTRQRRINSLFNFKFRDFYILNI
jgi:hypothetical protein